MSKPKYDSTVARIAGNIASALAPEFITNDREMHGTEMAARICVALARAIVEETKRTEPPE